MPSRQQVQSACQRCRQKRAKCNGEQPCSRCDKSGEVCKYSRRPWLSKSDLRAEIRRLRQRLGDANRQRAQEQSSSSAVNTNAAVQGWIDGIRSPDLDNGPSVLSGSKSIAFSFDSMPGNVLVADPSTPTNGSTSSMSCFDHLLSWQSCHPTFQQRNRGRSSSSASTAGELSLPSAPLDAYGTSTEKDIWTQTGLTRAHIRHLFDILVTWDNISLCVLQKKEFLQDYEAGCSEFCSSALVHALLALSMRLLNEAEDDSHILPSGWPGSKYFLHKAEALLQEQGSAHSLPDIQSLGILAFYHVRCGREKEARELAELCSASIRSLCLRESDAGELAAQYIKVRANTYCGATSLLRMFYLTTGVLFSEAENTQEDHLILDQLPCDNTGAATVNPGLSRDNAISLQLANSQSLIMKMFQLTEWAYKTIVAHQRASPSTKEDIIVTYKKCLAWYRDIFERTGNGGSRSPFTLFIHMYYHFCLLCAFRPFVGSDFAFSKIQPHEICAQAAQSILALAQSYDDLFTLRRVSALIPYFVCASGLFSLSVEGSGVDMDFINLRLRAKVGPQEPHPRPMREAGLFPSKTASLSQIEVSTAVHARLLLSKMGASHPAAAMAEEKLNVSLKTWRRSEGAGFS